MRGRERAIVRELGRDIRLFPCQSRDLYDDD